MANRIFRGDAPPVAQVTKITPANVLIGDEFTITCNGKSITYIAQANTSADVVQGLIALLTASTIPELTEFVAAASSDNIFITLPATTPGVPLTVTSSTKVTSAGNVTVTEITHGKNAVNEVHKIQLTGTYTGGTFTVTYNFGAGN